MVSINFIFNDDQHEVTTHEDGDYVFSSQNILQDVLDNKSNNLYSDEENDYSNNDEDSDPKNKEPSSCFKNNNLIKNIIGYLNEGIIMQRNELVNYREMTSNTCFISKIGPKNVKKTP